MVLTLKFERELVVVSMAGLLAWASQFKSKSAWPFKKRKFLNQFQRWLNKCYFLVRRRRHRHQRWRRRRRCRRRRRYVTFELCLRLFERKKENTTEREKELIRFDLWSELSWVKNFNLQIGFFLFSICFHSVCFSVFCVIPLFLTILWPPSIFLLSSQRS